MVHQRRIMSSGIEPSDRYDEWGYEKNKGRRVVPRVPFRRRKIEDLHQSSVHPYAPHPRSIRCVFETFGEGHHSLCTKNFYGTRWKSICDTSTDDCVFQANDSIRLRAFLFHYYFICLLKFFYQWYVSGCKEVVQHVVVLHLVPGYRNYLLRWWPRTNEPLEGYESNIIKHVALHRWQPTEFIIIAELKPLTYLKTPVTRRVFLVVVTE